MFFDLADRQTLPYTGDLGVQAIIAQFRDTPIAEVFSDVPEGDITGEQLYRLVDNRLNDHRQLIKVEKYTGVVSDWRNKQIAWYRTVNARPYAPSWYTPEFYREFDYSFDITPDALAVAQPLRETIAQLVPAIQGTDLDDIEVRLTPVVKSDRQIILYEHREQRFLAQPGKSPHVIMVDEEQYTVFERDEAGTWQQRGALPFYTRSEFADDPNTIERQMWKAIDAEVDAIHEHIDELDAIGIDGFDLYVDRLDELQEQDPLVVAEPLQRMTIKEEKPYPSAVFTPPSHEQHGTPAYKTITTRRIYATLPEELTFDPLTPEDFGEPGCMFRNEQNF